MYTRSFEYKWEILCTSPRRTDNTTNACRYAAQPVSTGLARASQNSGGRKFNGIIKAGLAICLAQQCHIILDLYDQLNTLVHTLFSFVDVPRIYLRRHISNLWSFMCAMRREKLLATSHAKNQCFWRWVQLCQTSFWCSFSLILLFICTFTFISCYLLAL